MRRLLQCLFPLLGEAINHRHGNMQYNHRLRARTNFCLPSAAHRIWTGWRIPALHDAVDFTGRSEAMRSACRAPGDVSTWTMQAELRLLRLVIETRASMRTISVLNTRNNVRCVDADKQAMVWGANHFWTSVRRVYPHMLAWSRQSRTISYDAMIVVRLRGK